MANTGSIQEIIGKNRIMVIDGSMSTALENLGADYWISFSCMDGKHICEGDLIRDCAKVFSSGHPHLKMIGVNCTKPEYIESLIRELRAGLAGAALPIGVYPNSGEEYDAITKTWHGSGDGKDFGEYALAYMKAGADAVGGCCTTVQKHVRQVIRAREQFLAEGAPVHIMA